MRSLIWCTLGLILCTSLVGCGGGGSSTTSQVGISGGGSPQDTFFALDLGSTTPWPNSLGVKFGIWRSLGAQLRWSTLQPIPPATPTGDPTDPSYNWSNLDQYLQQTNANGQQVLFTAFYTPAPISQSPYTPCQADASGSQTPGGCYPATDVESGDNYWKAFLTALYKHVSNNGGHISYWECWNEPNIPTEYAGSMQDLSTMCADLRSTISSLDPTAKFTTPAPTGGSMAVSWLQTWLSVPQNVASADIIAFHGYTCDDPNTCTASNAELIEPIVSDIKSLSASAAAGKPIWDTEGSDDAADIAISDPNLHAAFLARYLVLQQAGGVASFSYWGWNFGSNINLEENGQLNPAGVAYQQLYNWTAGATYPAGCSSTGAVYTCALTKPSGDGGMIVWDSTNVSNCFNDVCGSTTFTIPVGSSFTKCTDLAGNSCSSAIANGAVRVGAEPVLLQ